MRRRQGYHSRAVLRALNDSPWKTRIAAPKQTGFSRWHGDEAARRAVTNNRARLKSGVAREAFKLRAEIVERCFAHNLDRGGMRRTWLRGRENVHKRYLLHVAGHNLSLLMRQLIGAGTPRRADMAVFSFCSRPPGPRWWHGGARKAARRLSPPHSSSGSESRKKPLNPAFVTMIWRRSDSTFIINVLVLIRMGFNKTGCFQDALCGLRQTGGVCRLRRRRDHLGRRCPVTARTGAPDTSVRTHGGLFHRSPGSRTPNPCPSRPSNTRSWTRW